MSKNNNQTKPTPPAPAVEEVVATEATVENPKVTETPVDASTENTQEHTSTEEVKVDNNKEGVKVESAIPVSPSAVEPKKYEEKKSAIRFLSKDIVAIDIVHNKSEKLPEKLKVELIDGSDDIATILTDGKYYRIPKSIMF